MTIQLGTLERLASFVGRSLAQLQVLLAEDQVSFFFTELGVDLPSGLLSDSSFLNALSVTRGLAGELASLVSNLDTAAQGDDSNSVEQLAEDLLAKIAATIGSFAPIVAAVGGISASRMAEDLVIRGLELELPNWMGVGTFLGVIERTIDLKFGSADEFRPRQAAPAGRAFHLDRLADALLHPDTLLETLFGWGSGSFDENSLPARLATFIQLLGYPAGLVTSGPDSPRVQSYPLIIRPNPSTSPPGLDFTLKFEMPDGFDLSLPLAPGLEARSTVLGEFDPGAVLTVVPPARVEFVPPTPGFSASLAATLAKTPVPPDTSIVLVGALGSSVIEVGALTLSVGLNLDFDGTSGRAVGEPFARVEATDGHVLIDLGSGDGLLQSLTGGGRLEATFEAALSYTLSGGLVFDFGSSIEVVIPLHVTFAGIDVRDLRVGLPFGAPGRGGVPIDVSTTLRATFGPFSLLIQGVGISLDATFGSGNLGVANIEPSFKFPSGIGVAIDGGGISGGGFLAHDALTGRYSGAIELRVFTLGLKAFGVLDTRFPDGTEGMSFVVVIIAEFTPIQLGFGFTLNGVGGLLGVNRTVAEQALGDAVRAGSLEHLLFPVNVVANAPAIINDLATVFPATKGHQIFGPMAKFGWGTPTLISGEIGIIIEFPGPRLALLGVIRMQLPSAQFAILNLNLAIVGLLDFPAQKFSIDASLFDSYVAGFGVSGDMAYRMELGSKPSFLLSVGGFNPGFHPPPQYPTLRRASADLGLNGNPSLTASGYFAITSNTAQFGASLELRARGFGIRLRGGLAIDVLFIFSPFSFSAGFSAGVHVDFHGFGIGVSLHGNLSGPTPWHFNGKACVEVCIWDACLPVDIKFGRAEPASLPELDPWDGTDLLPDTDPRVAVRGLNLAIQDPRSWEGEAPPEGFSVVSLAAAASSDRTPIDPLGAALLRQKVCPLNQELERFGAYKPIGHTHFEVSAVTLGTRPLENFDFVEDQFAPASFTNLSNAQKLSASSYDRMIGGVRLAPNTVASGPSATQTLEYETVFITADGQRIEEGTGDPRYSPTQPELRGMLLRSSAGRAGIRRGGAQKYMLAGRPKLLTLDEPTFVVADACNRTQNTTITPIETTHTQALLALRQHEQATPADRNRFRVLPFFAAA